MKGRPGNKDKERLEKWKNKAKDRSKAIKKLRMENRRLRTRSLMWKSRYQEQKQELKQEPVARHSYGLDMVWLGVQLHLCYNVSLRATSHCLCLKAAGLLYGLQIDLVSASTIRTWCLKVGLYFLQQPIAKGKYVLIGDESIGTGRDRLLVLLLVPVEAHSFIRPLQMEDVYVLDVQTKPSWKGQEVAELIKKKTEQDGITIEYAISDAGSNLRKGFKDSKILWVKDCTHAVANATQALLKKDEPFQEFIQHMLATRAKWVLSQYNLYLPPALRAKSRFHQLLVVHQWADKILAHWQQMPVEVQQELHYVWNKQELIAVLRDLHQLIEIFACLFKATGINTTSLKNWHQSSQAWTQQKLENNQAIAPKVEQFLTMMNQYLDQQRAVLPNHDQILCCSDVIESIFGKYKNKGTSPFITEDILTIAAYPKKISKQEVKQALEHILCKDIQQWKKDFTTPSTLILKRQLFKKMAA